MGYISVSTATAPTAEVVTLGELKEAARVNHSAHDMTLQSKIDAAVLAIEAFLRRKLAAQTVDVVWRELDGVNYVIVPFAPRSITSVKLTSDTGVESTVTSTDYALIPGSNFLLFRNIPSINTNGWMTVKAAVGYTSIPAILKDAVAKLATRYYRADSGGDEVNYMAQLEQQLPPDIMAQVKAYQIPKI